MIAFLLLMLLPSSFAQVDPPVGKPVNNQNCADCGPIKVDEPKPPTENWAANDVLSMSAPCYRKTPYTLGEMSAWLNKERPPNHSSAMVKGFYFQNENPALIDGFRLLVGSDKFKDVKSSKCHTVKCAVAEVFGEKRGFQLLFMLERFGFNGSEFTQTNADAWKTEELDRVLIGLSAFPENTLPQKRTRPLIHFLRGYSLEQYSALEAQGILGNATIEFFDPWDKHTEGQKSYAVVHETGHVLASWTGDADAQAHWMDMSGGWQKVSTVGADGKSSDSWTAGDSTRVVSKYGLTSPGEDFAESISAYRFNPLELKRRSPDKYEFLKTVYFDGLEYTSEAACQPSKATSVKLRAAVIQKMKNRSKFFNFTDEAAAAVEATCAEQILNQLGTKAVRPEDNLLFRACVKEAIRLKMVKVIAEPLLKGKPMPVQIQSLISAIPETVVQEKWVQKAADRTRDEMVESLSLAAMAIYKKAVSEDITQTCTTATRYADQEVNIADPEFATKFDSSSMFYAFQHASELRVMMKSVCEDLKAASNSSRTVTIEQAKKAISKFIN